MKASERIHGELVEQGLGLDDDEMRERIIAALDEVVSKLEKDVAGTERARSAYARNYSEAVAENDRLRGELRARVNELEAYKGAVDKVLEKRHRESQKTMHGARVGPDWAKAIGFNEAANLLRVSLGLEPRSLEELTDGEG